MSYRHTRGRLSSPRPFPGVRPKNFFPGQNSWKRAGAGLFSPAAWLLLFFLLLASGCTPRESAREKLARAERYLQEHGGSASYRARAYILYTEAFPELESKEDKDRAHFGLGTIPLLDLVQAGLWGVLAGSPSSSPPPALPPELLFPLVDRFIQSFLKERILDHYAPLTTTTGFSFRFQNLKLPNPLPGTTLPVDLGGIWDQGDLKILYGAIAVLLGAWEYLKAYEGLVPFLLTLLTTPLPATFPTVPQKIPEFLSAYVSQATSGKLPWLDPESFQLKAPEAITRSRALLLPGVGSIREGFELTEGEATPEELSLFARTNPLFHLALRFNLDAVLGVSPDLLEPALTSLNSALLARIFSELEKSFADPNTAFTFPPEVWELLRLAIGLLGKGKVPATPKELGIPALRLAFLYAQPVPDLKALLPLTPEGRFAYESEQEPWEDGNGNGIRDCQEPFSDQGAAGALDTNGDGVPDPGAPPGKGDGKWNDPPGLRDGNTLPPLYHRNPRGVWEPPNGVVNPLYLFFPDPTFGGVLVPLQGSEMKVFPDLTTPYTNPTLNRLLSLLLFIAQLSLAPQTPCP